MSEITVWIEAALAATVSDDCVVIVNDVSEANLRWALNALTTNGQMHHRTATVIAVVRPAGAGHAVVDPVSRFDRGAVVEHRDESRLRRGGHHERRPREAGRAGSAGEAQGKCAEALADTDARERLGTDVDAPQWMEERAPREELPVVVLFDGWTSFFRDRVVPWRITMALKVRDQFERAPPGSGRWPDLATFGKGAAIRRRLRESLSRRRIGGLQGASRFH